MSAAVLRTPLCDRLGIEVAIVQAPIGSASTPELAAGVAEAGALGMLALTWVSVEEAVRRVRRVRELTDRAFGVNLVLAFPISDLLDACLDEHVPIVSTFWGRPDAASERIHAGGALHLHTVGTADEARRVVAAGVDVVVAQGWEAGGHVTGRVSTMALTPAVVDAVAPVPVIAAGGIGDGRGLAAVLTLGAQAGWLGTRFLTATEASAHDVYRRRVLESSGDDAVHTGCFDGGWPNAPHRALLNSTLIEWQEAGSPPAPVRPGEGDIVATAIDGRTFLRYDDMMPLRGMEGDLEAMALYAGQSAGLVRTGGPAAEIVASLIAEANAALSMFWDGGEPGRRD
jgi:NAD(P)H-dependent flavin oxidoreductase YrpB (nitropropane dioxygenase family)